MSDGKKESIQKEGVSDAIIPGTGLFVGEN